LFFSKNNFKKYIFKVEIHCEKTQYRAEIEFITKPIFRGKAHQIQGNIFYGHTSKKPIIQLKGEWNSQIYIRKGEGGDYQLFTNVLAKADVNKVFLKKFCREGKNFIFS